MTRLNIDQLPPELRDKVRAQLAQPAQPAATGRRRGPEVSETPQRDGRWRCHGCGAEFKAWAAAERHGHQAGHVRIDVVLED